MDNKLYPLKGYIPFSYLFCFYYFSPPRRLQFSSVQSLSRVRLFATPWIAALQASLSITNSQSSLKLTSFILLETAAAAKSLQSCPTLWDPIEGSPPCSPIPGGLQARTLEWVAISFSKKRKKEIHDFHPNLALIQRFLSPWMATLSISSLKQISRSPSWYLSPSATVHLDFIHYSF